jgi:hypothetical protein
LAGCPIFKFLGDPSGYKFTGTIRDSISHARIASAKVIASCKNYHLDAPVEVLSDINGEFTIQGYGEGTLDDCRLTVEHPKFKRKIIKLQPALELKPQSSLIIVWRLDVELEPL